MLIKDLISQLEALYNTYDDEYKKVFGEPEIMIDTFRLKYPNSCNYVREYAGFSGNVVISKSSDGINDILSAFYEDQDSKHQTQEFPGSAWPKEESWET